jgi:KipI family sensor histidine kinase inhibitor
MDGVRYVPASDASLLVYVAEQEDDDAIDRVHALTRALLAQVALGAATWILDVHPGATSVLVEIDLARASLDDCRAFVARVDTAGVLADAPRTITVPVRYGGVDGPDLIDVAAHCRISPEEVVLRHASVIYRVAFLGFVPGFAYLHGMQSSLACPRLDVPRTNVAAGSVGIGGQHTGVYPSAGPGGWRIIGRTDVDMLKEKLGLGDRVRFVDARLRLASAEPTDGGAP